MTTIRTIAQIAANRTRIQGTLVRQAIEAQRLERRRLDPATYQRYDADAEQSIVVQSGVERPALQLLTNAGLSAGQSVEFQDGAIDSTPRIRPTPALSQVLPAPDGKWSLILQQRRWIGLAIAPDLVFWEYSHTGQIKKLLTLPNRYVGTPNASFGFPYEILPALDDQGLWLDAKTLTLVNPSDFDSVEGQLTLYHTLNGQPVPRSNSWRRNYANLPVMISLDPGIEIPAGYNPCIDFFQGQDADELGASNLNESSLLLFSPILDFGLTGAIDSGDILIGGQLEGSATLSISQLSAVGQSCEIGSPVQTLQIQLGPIPLERFGLTRTDSVGTENPRADTIRALTLLYFTESF